MSIAVLEPLRKLELPADVCRRMGIAPGDKIDFQPLPDGTFTIRPVSIPDHIKASSALTSREERFARLRVQIANTPPEQMKEYEQETAQWETAELTDGADLQ